MIVTRYTCTVNHLTIHVHVHVERFSEGQIDQHYNYYGSKGGTVHAIFLNCFSLYSTLGCYVERKNFSS